VELNLAIYAVGLLEKWYVESASQSSILIVLITDGVRDMLQDVGRRESSWSVCQIGKR
jgi:hypothetical protein